MPADLRQCEGREARATRCGARGSWAVSSPESTLARLSVKRVLCGDAPSWWLLATGRVLAPVLSWTAPAQAAQYAPEPASLDAAGTLGACGLRVEQPQTPLRPRLGCHLGARFRVSSLLLAVRWLPSTPQHAPLQRRPPQRLRAARKLAAAGALVTLLLLVPTRLCGVRRAWSLRRDVAFLISAGAQLSSVARCRGSATTAITVPSRTSLGALGTHDQPRLNLVLHTCGVVAIAQWLTCWANRAPRAAMRRVALPRWGLTHPA